MHTTLDARALSVLLVIIGGGCQTRGPDAGVFDPADAAGTRAEGLPTVTLQPGFDIEAYERARHESGAAMLAVEQDLMPRLGAENAEERVRAMRDIAVAVRVQVDAHVRQQEPLFAFADRELGPLYTEVLRHQHAELQGLARALADLADKAPAPFAGMAERQLKDLLALWSSHRRTEFATIDEFALGSERDRLWAAERGRLDATWVEASRARAAVEAFSVEEFARHRVELLYTRLSGINDLLLKLDADDADGRRQAVREIAAYARMHIAPHARIVEKLYALGERLRGVRYTEALRQEHADIEQIVAKLEAHAAEPNADLGRVRADVASLTERVRAHMKNETYTIGQVVVDEELERRRAEDRVRLREAAK